MGLALSIAQGLFILHQCGIIHGDVKAANVLIFNKPNNEFQAKLTDFSHSLFNTGEERHLVGGTPVYAAPEWKTKLPTQQLMKTDVYSFGMVFVNLILGANFFDNFYTNGEDLVNMKTSNKIIGFIEERLNELEEADGREMPKLRLISDVLKSTLALDPQERSLHDAIKHLSGM